MERAIEVFALVQSIIMGVSHLLQPRAWVEFFIWLRERGRAGVFVNAFLSLSFGSIVVAFHNVWTGIPAVLTVLGWLQLLKALALFTAPDRGLLGMQRLSLERAWEFRVAGGVLLVVATLLGYHLLTT